LYKQFERKPFTNIAITFLGIFYTAAPFALLNIAVFEKETYNYQIILGSLLILWATDTGAYFAGSIFGKRKLFERISPKKSWEGFAGGAILAMVFAYGSSIYFTSLAQWQWLCIGWIIIIGGTYGDLVCDGVCLRLFNILYVLSAMAMAVYWMDYYYWRNPRGFSRVVTQAQHRNQGQWR
jgi:phosphatidate cytidylyltransferase